LKKSFIIFAVVCLIAVAVIIGQRKYSAASPANYTKEDISKVLSDMLPPQQLAQLKADPKQREEFRKNIVRLLAIYADAEQRGLLQQPDTRKQLDVVYLQVIAEYWNKSDEGKKSPIKKEDVDKFYKEKPTAFDDFLAGQPKMKQNPNLDGIKQQYGEFAVAKQRAEAAGVPGRRDFQLQWKLLQANQVANNLVQQLQSSLNATDPELQAFYDSHKSEFDEMKASHILISTMPKQPQPGPDGKAPTEMPKPLTKEEAKKKAEEILAKLKAGGDFAKLAAENSEDGSKSQGGDLGYFRAGQMVKPFEEAAKSLKPGEITKEVVETQFGYHIIKLTDRRIAPLDDTLKADIRERLKRDKLEAKLDEMAKKYNIQVPADFDIPEPKMAQMPPGMPNPH
jgi:peptidyl-prolyl cis-trans isomerase C